MTTIYGIKNCDTMKKALSWLEENISNFTFHDYRKDGVPEDILKQAIQEHGWENVINRRGTTWRALPDATKDAMNDNTALEAAKENPALIKRPLLKQGKKTFLGFKPDTYAQIFS